MNYTEAMRASASYKMLARNELNRQVGRMQENQRQELI